MIVMMCRPVPFKPTACRCSAFRCSSTPAPAVAIVSPAHEEPAPAGAGLLGPGLAARDIVDSVKLAGAQVLVLGLTTTASKTTGRELRIIVCDVPRDVELWIGGPAAVRHAAVVGRRGLVFHDYNAYQQSLVRIGGRIA